MENLSMAESPLALGNNDAAFEKNDSSSSTQRPQSKLLDPNMDPKKLKRVMASRQYSQKYRMKQLQYILQLETEVKALQAEVAITSPRIKYMDRQNSLLRVENGSMTRRLSAFSSELMFKEAQYEELKKERDSLKQFYVVNEQVPDFFKAPPPPSQNYHHITNFNLNHSTFT